MVQKKNGLKTHERRIEDAYENQLRLLQIELVKLQRHFISHGERILVLIEGRDGAGKDGTIKRIVQHLSPRETRVVALGKPSDHEEGQWYFQRYVPHLPSRGEFVLFNRSWYNRAGVEKVMGFCSENQYDEFMRTVTVFEQMLVSSGIKLFKYYLDISRAEQVQRLKDRKLDPLKQWKISPIDEAAVRKWKAYSVARDAMLLQTNHLLAPWTVIHSDDKKGVRINLLRHLLSHLNYPGKESGLLAWDTGIVSQWPAGGGRLPTLAA
jgi:polyphosphate kinase 2